MPCSDKKCALCLKYFPVNLKKHIKEVHDGLNNPWELWLGGFFSNNWFMHIGKMNVMIIIEIIIISH